MKKLCSSIIFFLMFIFTVQAAQLPSKFPRGCRPIGYSFRNGVLILNPVIDEASKNPLIPEKSIQTLYFIRNIAGERVQLRGNRLPHQPFSASHFNIIESNQWSAFAVDEALVELSCKVDSAFDERGLNNDCEQMLEVCQYSRAKFAEHNTGTYWIIHSDSLGNVINATANNGILLRW